MKTTMLSVISCALLGAGALQQARAQTTNVTLNVNIALTGVASSDTDKSTPVHVATKDVINAIATDLGDSFSSKAKLVAVSSGGGSPSFIIRDGGTDTPVPSGVLGVESIGDSVKNERTAASGAVSGTEASIQHFVLSTSTLSFDVQGYTSASVTNRGRGKDILPDTTPVSLSSKVSGIGSVGGNGAVLQGTVSASGRKVEETQGT